MQHTTAQPLYSTASHRRLIESIIETLGDLEENLAWRVTNPVLGEDHRQFHIRTPAGDEAAIGYVKGVFYHPEKTSTNQGVLAELHAALPPRHPLCTYLENTYLG